MELIVQSPNKLDFALLPWNILDYQLILYIRVWIFIFQDQIYIIIIIGPNVPKLGFRVVWPVDRLPQLKLPSQKGNYIVFNTI